jgi:hypothetical protein
MILPKVLASGSWISVFGLSWLLIFNVIKISTMIWGFWIFFLVIATISSISLIPVNINKKE